MDASTVGFFGYLFYNPYYFSGTLVKVIMVAVLKVPNHALNVVAVVMGNLARNLVGK